MFLTYLGLDSALEIYFQQIVGKNAKHAIHLEKINPLVKKSQYLVAEMYYEHQAFTGRVFVDAEDAKLNGGDGEISILELSGKAFSIPYSGRTS